MLRSRILTAIILVPIVLWLIFYASPLIFLEATIVILLLASWEWSHLCGLTHIGARFLYFYMICMLQVLVFVINPLWVLWVSAIFWCIAFLLILFYPRVNACNTVFVRGLMGAFVLTPCIVALNVMRSWEQGSQLLLYFLLLIWIADTAAYFAGKRYGVTKLAPLVSPGKSVQGLIGAISVTFLFSLLYAIFSKAVFIYYVPFFVGLSLITMLFSVVGDLFESMLKREVGVKDSGSLLPGHGGILDRIDSITAAAPIFLIGLFVLKQI